MGIAERVYTEDMGELFIAVTPPVVPSSTSMYSYIAEPDELLQMFRGGHCFLSMLLPRNIPGNKFTRFISIVLVDLYENRLLREQTPSSLVEMAGLSNMIL